MNAKIIGPTLLRKAITVLVVVLTMFLCCFVLIYLGDLDTTMHEVPWHIQGQIFDNASNKLAGVNVSVSTIESIGGVNSIFGRGPRKESHFETTSSVDGRFDLNVKGVDVQIRFEKTGFVLDKRAFWYGGTVCDSTNQNLKIVLKPQEAPTRQP